MKRVFSPRRRKETDRSITQVSSDGKQKKKWCVECLSRWKSHFDIREAEKKRERDEWKWLWTWRCDCVCREGGRERHWFFFLLSLSLSHRRTDLFLSFSHQIFIARTKTRVLIKERMQEFSHSLELTKLLVRILIPEIDLVEEKERHHSPDMLTSSSSSSSSSSFFQVAYFDICSSSSSSMSLFSARRRCRSRRRRRRDGEVLFESIISMKEDHIDILLTFHWSTFICISMQQSLWTIHRFARMSCTSRCLFFLLCSFPVLIIGSSSISPHAELNVNTCFPWNMQDNHKVANGM